MRKLRLAGGAMAVAALLASSAQAQDTAEVKRLTVLTFSAPVQLPGKTLPAGSYRFEMADINNAAHIVRVLNADGTQVVGTFTTIPATTEQTRPLEPGHPGDLLSGRLARLRPPRSGITRAAVWASSSSTRRIRRSRLPKPTTPASLRSMRATRWFELIRPAPSPTAMVRPRVSRRALRQRGHPHRRPQHRQPRKRGPLLNHRRSAPPVRVRRRSQRPAPRGPSSPGPQVSLALYRC